MSILSKIKEAVLEDDIVQPPTHTLPSQTLSPMPPFPVAPPSGMRPPFDQGSAPISALPPNDATGLHDLVHPKSGPLVLFLATLQSLEQYIQDEGARFHAAQETVKAQGVDIGMVMSEIQAASGRIDGEITSFEAARQRKTETDVTQRETSIADVVRQIADLSARRDGLTVALAAAKAKISDRTDAFNGSVRAVRSQYEDLTRKVNMYLVAAQAVAR